MRNLEFKAVLSHERRAFAAARAAGAELWGDLRQTDTYFRVPHGRLKLRETAGYAGQLVYYERDEAVEGRPSDYFVTAIADVAPLRQSLTLALGVLVEVRKRRTLLLLDTTQIHLDNVEDLGAFLEIEVPAGDDGGAARRQIDFLIEALGYRWDDCIRRSYSDMMIELQA